MLSLVYLMPNSVAVPGTEVAHLSFIVTNGKYAAVRISEFTCVAGYTGAETVNG